MKVSSGASEATTGSWTEIGLTLWRFSIAFDVRDSKLSRQNRSSLSTMMMSNGWLFEDVSPGISLYDLRFSRRFDAE